MIMVNILLLAHNNSRIIHKNNSKNKIEIKLNDNVFIYNM